MALIGTPPWVSFFYGNNSRGMNSEDCYLGPVFTKVPFTVILKGRRFGSNKLSYPSTLIYQINAHVRLFIFNKKSGLCGLIRYCAFINFWEKIKPVLFFTLIKLFSY